MSHGEWPIRTMKGLTSIREDEESETLRIEKASSSNRKSNRAIEKSSSQEKKAAAVAYDLAFNGAYLEQFVAERPKRKSIVIGADGTRTLMTEDHVPVAINPGSRSHSEIMAGPATSNLMKLSASAAAKNNEAPKDLRSLFAEARANYERSHSESADQVYSSSQDDIANDLPFVEQLMEFPEEMPVLFQSTTSRRSSRRVSGPKQPTVQEEGEASIQDQNEEKETLNKEEAKETDVQTKFPANKYSIEDLRKRRNYERVDPWSRSKTKRFPEQKASNDIDFYQVRPAIVVSKGLGLANVGIQSKTDRFSPKTNKGSSVLNKLSDKEYKIKQQVPWIVDLAQRLGRRCDGDETKEKPKGTDIFHRDFSLVSPQKTTIKKEKRKGYQGIKRQALPALPSIHKKDTDRYEASFLAHAIHW